MKALTLWQPWAWLLFTWLRSLSPWRPVKRVETRSWPTAQRGRIAIHAAKFRRLPESIYREIGQALKNAGDDEVVMRLGYFEYGTPSNLFGVVIGTVDLVDCVPIEQLYGSEYDTPLERVCGDWSPGRYGWILKDPILFKSPVPATGRQRLWNWDEE